MCVLCMVSYTAPEINIHVNVWVKREIYIYVMTVQVSRFNAGLFTKGHGGSRCSDLLNEALHKHTYTHTLCFYPGCCVFPKLI